MRDICLECLCTLSQRSPLLNSEKPIQWRGIGYTLGVMVVM
jgi:hypothetical protein